MLCAAWTLPVRCYAELPCDFFPEVLRLPIRAIAPNHPLGALEGVAFGCIVAYADGDFGVERTDRDGTGCRQRVVHSCAEIIGVVFGGHVGRPSRLTAQAKKWPRMSGPFSLIVVVPVMVTPNNYRAVSIMVVPAVVPSAIIPTVISVVPVTIVSVVATDPETELLSTGERRCCHTECRHCGEDITNLPHCASPFAGYDWQTRKKCRRSGNSRETLLNKCSPSLQCGSTSSSRDLQARSKEIPSARKALKLVRSAIGEFQTCSCHKIGYDPRNKDLVSVGLRHDASCGVHGNTAGIPA